jgi:putative FmdB family regulatory protein
MPLYEYQCDACAHRFEVIQKFSDAPLTTCPKCGGPVRKLLSSPAIQFKGSGWYITDYARAGKSETASTNKAEGASAETRSESKGETKTETTTKTESKGESKTESKTEKSTTKPSSSTS